MFNRFFKFEIDFDVEFELDNVVPIILFELLSPMLPHFGVIQYENVLQIALTFGLLFFFFKTKKKKNKKDKIKHQRKQTQQHQQPHRRMRNLNCMNN